MMKHIRSVKNRYEAELLVLPNVIGVGIGLKEINGQITDQLSIIVNVSQKKPLSQLAPADVIPIEIQDIVTDVQEIGSFDALYFSVL